ncbi:MAG: DNA methyltransferase [Nitrospira sp.]
MAAFDDFRYPSPSMLTSLTPRSCTKVPIQSAPKWWKDPCAHEECTLHQLAPYIGKIKSKIAGDLIERYSKPGDLIVDPFAGAGTIPLEAAIRGRRAFAADISPYAYVLSKAKLSPPKSLEIAMRNAEEALMEAAALPKPDLRSIPRWIRQFFHPRTLHDALRFSNIARQPGNEFLMACFLGILHHQRPGFLSYPSSHLVPYLRDKKYPRQQYPEMYTYRELGTRLLAKVRRSYKRFCPPSQAGMAFRQSAIEHLDLPTRFDALITSPPYMNALDYGRDNRLRLWFINPDLAKPADTDIAKRRKAFEAGITSLAAKLEKRLTPRGYCVFVVGEEVHRSFSAHPSDVVIAIVKQHAPSLKLSAIITDNIPDVRRTRRECRGIKTEHFLVFQQS